MMKVSRKQFIGSTGIAGAGVLIGGRIVTVPALAMPSPETPPLKHVDRPLATPPLKKFVDQLPTAIPVLKPNTVKYPGADWYEVTMKPGSWRFHSGLPKPTPTWGYWGLDLTTGIPASIGLGYLGPTIEAVTGRPTIVKFVNKLTGRHPVQDAIDMTITGNSPAKSYPVGRAVPHLHGGFTPTQFDGQPHAWWDMHGTHDPMPGFYSLPGNAQNEAIFWYSNHQPAAMLWYHDHAMGITRLNVHAGLAGLYFVRDDKDTGKPGNPLGLPAGQFEIPLILQDKSFNPDGSLFYPTNTEPYPNYPHSKWVPEFFGDTPVINATAYPNLKVEPRRYRFRMVNAAQARLFNLSFSYGSQGHLQLPFYVIGMEQSFVPGRPEAVKQLLLSPGERADVIVDFSAVPHGTNLLLQNDAPAPYPDGGEVELPELMRIQVTLPLSSPDKTANPAKGKLSLPDLSGPLIPTVTSATPRRQVIMKELVDPVDYTPIEMKLNELHFDDPIEDKPLKGSTEVWEFINLTPDAHPMHVHLVRFQVLNRQSFDGEQFWADYSAWVAAGRPNGKQPDVNGLSSVGKPYLQGSDKAPAPREKGWKDTAIAYPREVMRVVAKFDLPTGAPKDTPAGPAVYVYHCHILEHEENDMMRPFEVV
jgi:spore coat protein A, manganese oxidase